jgi:P2 family phage contractile tail tube protein
MLEEIDMGDWKPGDKAENKYSIAPSYYKLEVDGQVIYELDYLNNVRVINGKDEAAEERAAIGM